jgi:hypothetical protein
MKTTPQDLFSEEILRTTHGFKKTFEDLWIMKNADE